MWSRRSIENLAGVALLAALAACSTTPKHDAQHDWAIVTHPSAGGKVAGAGKAGAPAGGGAQAVPGPSPVPAEARQEFDRALSLAHGGNDAAAEAQLADVAHRYPELSTPLIDLGILHRKDGDLDAAAKALGEALTRDPHSALAWTELGITQRLQGKFQDAQQSYGRAIAADPAYAPAYRDRGVLRDLYLDQPAAALGDFEQYRKLAGEDKPVSMWIAELSHRAGIKVPPTTGEPSPAAAAGPTSGGASPTPAAAAPASGAPPAAAAKPPASPPQARN